MACGVPVITSPVLEEVAADGAYIVANPSSEKDICLAMRKVVLDEELRSSLISAGLERSKLVSWQKCARQTMAAIEGV